jgi:hypothetical protein
MQACQRICFFCEAVQTHRTTKRRGCPSQTNAKPPIYFYAISLRSVNGNAYRQYGAIALFYLKQVNHSVLKPPQSLRRNCPMAGKKKLSIADTISFTGIEVHCRNQ